MSRLAAGGRVDRTRRIDFTVDGLPHSGFRGDTVASALVAAGVLEVGPSIYRGRPRGLLTADAGEPNALVDVRGEVLPATTVELTDGLAVRLLSGVGRLAIEAEPAVHDKMFVHADVVVVGGGPAGLAATLAASSGGARVILVDDQPELGGDLLADTRTLAGAPAADWPATVRAELSSRPEVRILSRTSVFGYYDQNYLLALERRTDHHPGPVPAGVPRQRLWHLRARRVVLATGSRERPLVFENNDRPGIMLAGAVRTYLNRFAAVPGRRVVVAATDDSAYRVALDLRAAGVEVAAIVDSRPDPPGDLAALVSAAGVRLLAGSVVCGTEIGPGVDVAAGGEAPAGGGRLRAVRVRRLDADAPPAGDQEHEIEAHASPAGDREHEIEADLLAVGGGWSPDVHLFSQSRGTLRWDDDVAGFVPDRAAQAVRCAGGANGTVELEDCLAEGLAAGREAAAETGRPGPAPVLPEPGPGRAPGARRRPRPVWLTPAAEGESARWQDHFVDLHRDASVADVRRAVGTGMRSLEHVKRYTTIGTGYDQGATASVNAAGVVAAALTGSGSPGDLGLTTFRAPSVPVPFAALAGRDVGRLHDPARVTPIQAWHEAHGARFEDVGQWRRPWYFPRPGEEMEAAVLRECRAARTGVAVMDASTLGKIEVVGRDAGEFLNRVYTNAFAGLAIGAARYGLMCTADGMVLDDGVTMRLAADRFYLTTTTGGAARVLDWLEEWHQTEWPHLDVLLTSVTEQWATIAVVGPRSREVVARLTPGLDLATEAFAHLTFRETELGGPVAGVPARVARVSFSGELAYEVNVAGWYALAVWEAVMSAGADLGITPYGTETMHVLRAEKGYPIVGQDTDGTVTPHDLGLSWMVSKKKDFIGKRSLRRVDAVRPDRKHLVGLLPVDPGELLPEGAQLVAADADLSRRPVAMLGHVTSSYRSAALARTFALALVKGGRDRVGETLLVPLGDRTVAVTVTAPVLYDPEGARRDG
jgi:sarcosine oxidase, subunit alpha